MRTLIESGKGVFGEEWGEEVEVARKRYEPKCPAELSSRLDRNMSTEEIVFEVVGRMGNDA